MVKFSFIALATALATASAAKSGSVVKKTVNLGDRKLRRGDPATEALLKKARPYKKAGAKNNSITKRRLDGEEDEFEIDGSYSLQFSECIDIKTYDEDLFDEDIVGYVKSGQIVASKSYVLFHVCQDDTCYLDAEDDLYLVDLPTYLTNVATYHANKRNDFCEQCERFDEYCNPEEEEEEEEAEDEDEGEEEGEENDEEEDDEGDEEDKEEEDEEEDRKRKLKKTKRKLTKRGNKKLSRAAVERMLAQDKEYIDCNQCQASECYVDEDDQDDQVQRRDELDEAVSEWIGGISECQETGVQWGDLDLYVGAMCSPYGDGVELAVFANDECTWYTNQKAFSDVYNYANDENNEYNVNYLTYAESFIKSAFSEVMPCLEKEYDDPDEDDDNAQDEDEEVRAHEYCQGVMEEEVVSFANCQADDDEEEEEDDENAYNYDWFTYDMKEADEVNKVCVALNAMEHDDYSHVYDEESSGTWYKRNKKGAIITGEEKEGMSGGAIFAIVLVVLGVVGAVGFFAMKAKKGKVETDYQGGEMS